MSKKFFISNEPQEYFGNKGLFISSAILFGKISNSFCSILTFDFMSFIFCIKLFELYTNSFFDEFIIVLFIFFK